ncbi:hypothetical protein [Alicyclobacillus shizuokensis]|uniref:hypothetical protein n=1 Tax=Alicyclobacillus shizuokensis TaxID=392014 RepID=UPI0008319F14|nr:hypothetical protein [Alicyclobacillus shizuokensis]
MLDHKDTGKYTYWMKHFENGELIEVPESKIENISLDTLDNGPVIPLHQGGFAQIPAYWLYFWCPFLSVHAQSIFTHLIAHTYIDKNWCQIKRETLAAECNMSLSAFNKHFEQLERYKLAWRIEVRTPDGSNLPNIYITRRQMPLIPQELYDQLSDRLKDMHDQYIERMAKSGMLYLDVEYERPLPEPSPPPKRRGRPKGSKNKPKASE